MKDATCGQVADITGHRLGGQVLRALRKQLLTERFQIPENLLNGYLGLAEG
jgi:hypothetical protein